MSGSAFGARLQAALVALSVRNRVSRRDVVELGEELARSAAGLATLRGGERVAPSEAAARERFMEFDARWGKQYPAISKLWENAWSEFIPFLDTTSRSGA